MIEIWKPVVGHADYEVSSIGRVRSLLRGVRVLRPGLASNGYLTVALRGRKTRTAHSLVAEAFIGPRPIGEEVRHLDGNRANNSAVNLVYGTRVENRADSDRHGTAVRGSKYRNAKLDEEKARMIRALKGVVPQRELARRYRVSSAAVQAVHDGRTWTHV
jgi:hypothetical protein